MFESPERDLTPAQEREWRAQYAHGELVADRLHQLVAKGYRPIWGGDTSSYELIHPHKEAIQVDLWPDGQVVGRSPTTIKNGSRTIIAAEDAGRFKRFLAAVPKPSWRDRLCTMTIGEAATHVPAWIGLLVLWGVSYVVVDWIWRLIRGH
jgi:hypothetical protein